MNAARAVPDLYTVEDDARDRQNRAVAHFMASVGECSQPEYENAVQRDSACFQGISGDIGDYLTSPPPALHWFAGERLLADRAHLLTGIGGSSKTRLLYHLAMAGIIGRLPWGWSVQRTGSAALFLTEDSASNVHRTLAAFAAHAGMTQAELGLLADKLKIFPLAGHDCKLLAAAPGGTLVENANYRGLLDTCRAIPDLVFVGLDPALGLTGGDENNQTHQRRLGELADRLALELGACVVLASHSAKALQGADEIGSHSSRGGGAITDAVRAEFVLRTMTAGEAKRYGIEEVATRKGYVQLVATKGNELPPDAFAPVWLVRGQGGILAEANLQEVERESAAIGKRELQALEILRTMTEQGTASVMDWGRECASQKLVTGTPDGIEKGIHRIKKSLLSAGLIEPGTGRGAYLPVRENE